MYNKLLKMLKTIKKITSYEPEIAIVLGSGLGSLADEIEDKEVICYEKIGGFPISTVVGHKGNFVLGKLGGKKVIAMQGRVHYYEGYATDEVILPIRLMFMMGAKRLIVTNAAGGINLNYNKGDLMIIKDHICLAPNPLIGHNIKELGERFPDMSNPYNVQLIDILKVTADEQEIKLREGVYLQVTGPSYETKAEIKAYRQWGADAVGMSTAVEVIAAVHMGMEVVGISLITNAATGVKEETLSHEDVFKVADNSSVKLKNLIKKFIENIDRQENQ